MNKTLLSSVIALLTLTNAADIRAAQTNLVQSLRVNLTALFQGSNVTNDNVVTYAVIPRKITNADIIQKLGVGVSKNFSVDAKLLLITPLVPKAQPMVVVQDGANRVDVSGFVSLTKDDIQVEKGSANLATEAQRGIQYTIFSLRLKDNGNYPNLSLHFRVRGFAGIKYTTLSNSNGDVIGEAEEQATAVSGTGDLNGQDAVVRGTVSITGRTTEIQN